MRRFDKLKSIKEANLVLENKYLNSIGLITEQESSTPEETTPAATPAPTDSKPTAADNDYISFKKELNLKGDDKKSGGIVPGYANYRIDITTPNLYVISNAKDKSVLQKGTFKSKGVWPAKHIELTPEGTKDVFKIKTIITNMEKKSSENVTDDFFTNLKEIVKSPNQIRSIGGTEYRYPFLTQKSGLIWMAQFKPTYDGEGTFQLLYLQPQGKVTPLSNSTGTFTEYGKLITLNEVSKGIDKKGKIDSALIELISVAWPDFKM